MYPKYTIIWEILQEGNAVFVGNIQENKKTGYSIPFLARGSRIRCTADPEGRDTFSASARSPWDMFFWVRKR